MKYRIYTPAEIEYLRKHYPQQSLKRLADYLGVDNPRKVFDLARRHGIRKRAFNGAPQWRYPTER
jgi:hypothetical protein